MFNFVPDFIDDCGLIQCDEVYEVWFYSPMLTDYFPEVKNVSGTGFIGTTSNGDRFVMEFNTRGKDGILTVKTDIWTRVPMDYGPSYTMIEYNENGL